jgi:hypothetical protein
VEGALRSFTRKEKRKEKKKIRNFSSKQFCICPNGANPLTSYFQVSSPFGRVKKNPNPNP